MAAPILRDHGQIQVEDKRRLHLLVTAMAKTRLEILSTLFSIMKNASPFLHLFPSFAFSTPGSSSSSSCPAPGSSSDFQKPYR